jgi:uracil-DNA glycosylase
VGSRDERFLAAAACAGRGHPLEPLGLVARLAQSEIGETFNQYAASPLLRGRLRAYLDSRAGSRVVLVGEAAGYRGARISGIPFTSERQLTGAGPAEATATIVHRVLARLGVEGEVLLWNVVPTHPGSETSNRRPTRAEVEAAAPFLAELTRGRTAIAVGRLAAAALETPYVRHPSHGGAAAFEAGLREAFATIGRRRARVRRFL